MNKEQIINILSDKQTYHLFVPSFPAVNLLPPFICAILPIFLSYSEIVSNYEETSLIYSALFLLGLLAMYYISTYTVKERDETQKLLFDEHEEVSNR